MLWIRPTQNSSCPLWWVFRASAGRCLDSPGLSALAYGYSAATTAFIRSMQWHRFKSRLDAMTNT
eukprot:scaffold179570_cov33-Tisochrysis_lutea.AAC.2